MNAVHRLTIGFMTLLLATGTFVPGAVRGEPRAKVSVKEKAGVKAEVKNIESKPFIPTPLPSDPNLAIKELYFTFEFHPQQGPIRNNILVDLKTALPSLDQFRLRYTPQETHGTRGSIANELQVSQSQEQGKKNHLLVKDTVTLDITPGLKPPEQGEVFEEAYFKDPFTFSDSDPSANFRFTPAADGLDYSLSLFEGTEFPAVYSTEYGAPGAVAERTEMSFVGRVSPGVISDPAQFWDAPPLGAVDLFRLTLSSDANHVVRAQLVLGASTSWFTVDYKDQYGESFDPFSSGTGPSRVRAIEQDIARAFQDGRLGQTLSDVHPVP